MSIAKLKNSKLYSDYMDEITKEKLYLGLLGHGLFADKLPPVFTSLPFYQFCVVNHKHRFCGSPQDYIRYDSVRNTNVPRALSIPTPFAYLKLCKCLSEHWIKIQKHLNKKTKNQTYKHSQIHIQKLKDSDVLFRMSLNYANRDPELEMKLNTLPILKRFCVRADISSCFPSVYSHSLVWALIGKTRAKKELANKKKYINNYYNQIDKCSMNIKNGETNGLLIGPHSSNLLSEIILCCIDQKLVSKHYAFSRYIDDYCCYTETEEKAEKFILDLALELKKFELALNTKKTKIFKLPLPQEDDWISALNAFFIGSEKAKNGKTIFKFKRLVPFLDLAIKLSTETGNCAVFTYAIKIISNYYLGKKSLNYYISFLHHLVCLYPYLVHWMEEYVFQPFNVSTTEISSIAHDLYDVGVKKHIYEACSFALYWSIRYDFEFDRNYAKNAVNSEDCIFMVMAYLIAKRYNVKLNNKVLRDKAIKLSENPNDFERHWLFVYECLSKDQLHGDYAYLKDNHISFIKKEFAPGL